jgi:hypothetical protein
MALPPPGIAKLVHMLNSLLHQSIGGAANAEIDDLHLLFNHPIDRSENAFRAGSGSSLFRSVKNVGSAQVRPRQQAAPFRTSHQHGGHSRSVVDGRHLLALRWNDRNLSFLPLNAECFVSTLPSIIPMRMPLPQLDLAFPHLAALRLTYDFLLRFVLLIWVACCSKW